MKKLIMLKAFEKDVKALESNSNAHYALFQTINDIWHDKKAKMRKGHSYASQGLPDIYSYRVTEGHMGVRLFVYNRTENERLLIACGEHDQAKKMAFRRALSEDGKNLGISTLPGVRVNIPCDGNDEANNEESGHLQPKAYEQMVKQPEPKKDDGCRPFPKISSEALKKLGFSQTQRVKILTLKTNYEALSYSDCICASPNMSAEVASRLADILLELADGVSPDTILEREEKQRQRPPIEELLVSHPEYKSFCHVLNYVLQPSEVEAFQGGTLENWELRLHPTQLKAVKIDADGPVVVKGPAGTGKTVVAIHRICYLLRKKGWEEKRILFLAYSATLVDNVRMLLQKLCTEEECDRVHIMTFEEFVLDAWTRGGEFSSNGYKGKKLWANEEELATLYISSDVNAFFSNAFTYTPIVVNRDEGFVRREYVFVILNYNIQTLEDYLSFQRPKEFGILGKSERKVLWDTFFEHANAIMEGLRRQQYRAYEAELNTLVENLRHPVTREAIADRDYLLNKYEVVVVDEIQDFSAAEYRFLAALTQNTFDKPRPTLFMCGDGRQRIYRPVGSFRQNDLNVIGRSITLTKCYRSTEAIRKFAKPLISPDTDIDETQIDINEGSSDMMGTEHPPEQRPFQNKQVMQNAIADKLKAWHKDVSLSSQYGDYAVLLYTNRACERTARALSRLGVPALHITKDTPIIASDGRVKVMTLHRSKGLQFIGVVVVLDEWMAYPSAYDQKDSRAMQAFQEKEKRLLYTAIMRAQACLFVTSSNGQTMDAIPQKEKPNPIALDIEEALRRLKLL